MPEESLTERLQRHKKLFDEIDTKNNGKFTLEDFERALQFTDHPLKDSHFAISQIYKSLAGQEAASDWISFEKFNQYLIQAEAQLAKGFENVDRDHDGKVTKKDVESYLFKLGLKPTPSEVDTFFRKLDFEDRGFVTFEMFRDGLLFIPRLEGSRVRTAFKFLNDEMENISSEGDVTVSDDVLKSVGYFLAGGLSGVVSRTCTAPFDRVKVFLIARTDLASTLLNNRQELQSKIEEKVHHPVSKKKIQSPLVRAVKTLYKQGGLRAFYVGNGLNVLKVFPESAMKFGSFEATKKFLCGIEGVDDVSKLSKVSTFVSGGVGGVIAQITVYPIDTLKYRIQCSSLDSKEKGNQLLVKTAKDMFKEGGVRIFYRGLPLGLGGMFPYAALDLGTFSTVKKWYIKKTAEKQHCSVDDVVLPNYLVLTLGAVSGTFGATMVYPINLLRTRLQAQGTFAHPYTYDGFFDVFKQTITREGVPGLFKGLVPNLAKVAPAVSISYLMYENLKVLFKLE
ncbi:hypothetical protein KL905_000225 [Ogataea polymorpha]|nr:hypothetical protein KL908_001338 [Ogataea polymorpha]KAG7902529.1 hypothetical protein KL935_001437 [Ogataea polymorpha]KAG7911483.1 hypothetical protein KL906_000804 [Ogataea polymorpha]KAG7912684.1 hypothetical protein KL907_000886 [Ogataea polymorpha]KAG7919298.1 hypothetical protein KL927_001427 [Ogataea polymorpha]